jgi:hypothetical protein
VSPRDKSPGAHAMIARSCRGAPDRPLDRRFRGSEFRDTDAVVRHIVDTEGVRPVYVMFVPANGTWWCVWMPTEARRAEETSVVRMLNLDGGE